MIEQHEYISNKTYQTNVSVMALDEEELYKFYDEHKDNHFWFQRALIGPTMKFMVVEETTGILWWKKTKKKCYFLDSNCNALEPKLISSMSEFLCEKLPAGLYVDIVTNTNYLRMFNDKIYLQYDYYVTKMGSVYFGESAPEDVIQQCAKYGLNKPEFEEGEFLFLSLGEIFKTFDKFLKYILECKEMNYELVLCLAKEEREGINVVDELNNVSDVVVELKEKIDMDIEAQEALKNRVEES